MRYMNVLRRRWRSLWPALVCWAVTAAAAAAPGAHLQVKIVTGGQELTAGSVVDLRIYVAGRAMQEYALAHGESWPRDSTRVIPLTLNEPLDPRTVARVGLYYRAANPSAADWEVVAGDVEVVGETGQTTPLLDTPLFGVLTRQGELVSAERNALALACVQDSDCDDHRSCNGRERCAPRAARADERGCVAGAPTVCPVNQICSEEHGCRGLATVVPASPAH